MCNKPELDIYDKYFKQRNVKQNCCTCTVCQKYFSIHFLAWAKQELQQLEIVQLAVCTLPVVHCA